MMLNNRAALARPALFSTIAHDNGKPVVRQGRKAVNLYLGYYPETDCLVAEGIGLISTFQLSLVEGLPEPASPRPSGAIVGLPSDPPSPSSKSSLPLCLAHEGVRAYGIFILSAAWRSTQVSRQLSSLHR
jgi:hypothetical protein